MTEKRKRIVEDVIGKGIASLPCHRDWLRMEFGRRVARREAVRYHRAYLRGFAYRVKLRLAINSTRYKPGVDLRWSEILRRWEMRDFNGIKTVCSRSTSDFIKKSKRHL